ncbi:MAG: hypothetical protein HDS24_04105 [Bacteroides sp.]|nr:hypothetical protein [Bacteroidales bacterium]MBD5291242.1 hypothetical protein [Bacteroides sp.]
MIYVFDDRTQRRKYNEDNLRDFSDIIIFDTVKLISGKSADESIFDSIENPECIIFHKSYALGDDNVTFETIRKLFADLEVPIVIFSGGTEGINKSAKETNINADLMYNNLPFFLENRKKNGVINIDTLLWGNRFKINSLLEFQNKMAEKYFINNDLDAQLDNPEKVKRDIKNLLMKTHVELAYAIISDFDINQDITWFELSNIINKNIHKCSGI